MPVALALPKTVNSHLERALETFIESSGKISANMLGMVNRVGGQIYALLFLMRKPLSLDEISDLLKTSKGNISVNIRLLENHGLVRKVWVKGSRKDYYDAARDYPRKLLRGFFDRVREGIEESLRKISECRADLAEAAKQVNGEDRQDASFMIAQLDLLTAFYEAASQIFDDFYQGRNVDVELLRRATLE